MKPNDDIRMGIVAGSLGAIGLGMLLVPLRSLTSASNLAFAFVALTIVLAELAGRSAALVTALMSAVSLNFFLTEPYLTLVISKPDDVVAFFALAVCGLIVAAFGRRREHWSELAGRAGAEFAVLQKLVEKLGKSAPLEEVLGELKQGFGLSALVLRDADDRVVAAVPTTWAPTSIPETRVAPYTLLPSEESRLRFGVTGLRLPDGGGRLRVPYEGGPLSLDMWEGDPRGFGVPEAQALTIAASVLALALSPRRVR
jgi:Domain of unknown function (DUF4118)